MMPGQKQRDTERMTILRRFGYPTTADEYSPSKLAKRLQQVQAERKATSFSEVAMLWLSLDETTARNLYLETMAANGPIFAQQDLACSGCETSVLLPIDLRRDGGLNYHGICYPLALLKEMGRNGLASPHLEVLEHRLRIARICSPEHDKPLAEENLEGLVDRKELEQFYFGKTIALTLSTDALNL